MGRRIIKTVAGTGSWDGTLNYYLDGDSVLEEQNGSNMTLKQFIWGSDYIDDLVQVSLNSSPSTQSTCDTPYWTMGDANWNMLGLVNASGILIERYEYTPYGERSVFMRSGSGYSGVSGGSNDPGCYLPLAASQRFVTSGSVTQFYGICEVGQQGLMHDEEDGIIYNRARDNDTLLGRWIEEDPLASANNWVCLLGIRGASTISSTYEFGSWDYADMVIANSYWDGMNLYQYDGSDPTGLNDPMGLEMIPPPARPFSQSRCQALLYDISRLAGELQKELDKFDPCADDAGGPVWKPGGHRIEIGNLRRGLLNRIQQFYLHCGGRGITPDFGPIWDNINTPLPDCPSPPPCPITSPIRIPKLSPPPLWVYPIIGGICIVCPECCAVVVVAG